MNEEYQPHTQVLEKERHRNDLFGYVISGRVDAERVGARPAARVGGDAFYLRAGQTHTARNDGDAVLKLVAVQLR